MKKLLVNKKMTECGKRWDKWQKHQQQQQPLQAVSDNSMVVVVLFITLQI
jgi:hypothetical protein